MISMNIIKIRSRTCVWKARAYSLSSPDTFRIIDPDRETHAIASVSCPSIRLDRALPAMTINFSPITIRSSSSFLAISSALRSGITRVVSFAVLPVWPTRLVLARLLFFDSRLQHPCLRRFRRSYEFQGARLERLVFYLAAVYRKDEKNGNLTGRGGADFAPKIVKLWLKPVDFQAAAVSYINGLV